MIAILSDFFSLRAMCVCACVLLLLSLLTNSRLIIQKLTRYYRIEQADEGTEKKTEIVAKTKVFFFLIGVINKLLEGISNNE